MVLTTGQKIRKLRKERGLSQDQLADKCGVISTQTINRWEHDRFLPSGINLVNLAKALGVSADEIIGDGMEKLR